MNKPVFFFFLTCLLSMSMKAQENLVPNGSFEEYDSCPQYLADFYCKNWFSGTIGTPDYYNICSSSPTETDVPSNFLGFQQPKQGNAYAGIVLNSLNDYREYIAIKLVSPLLINQHYIFQFYVSNAELDYLASNNFGILFLSDTNNLVNNYTSGVNPNSLIINPKSVDNPNIVFDQTNWVAITGSYNALGCEQYIVIGSFKSIESIVFDTSSSESESYYFIDDVTLFEQSEESSSNIFSPNADLINDSIYFPTYWSDSELTIMNRWGNELYKSNFLYWDGKFNGQEAPSGAYYYIVAGSNECTNKKEKRTGFFHLVR